MPLREQRIAPGTQPVEPNTSGPTPIVIEGGLLLSLVEGESPIQNARVHIGGGRIVALGKAEDKIPYPEGAQVLDAAEGLILPGLINGHCHSAMTLFRGLADDLPLKAWLFEKIFPAETRHLRLETVYWGSLLACLEMIASGTTTLLDGYFFQDGTMRAVHQAGLRALVAQGVIDFPAPGVPDPRDNLRIGREFLEKWQHHSDLIIPGLFCHSTVTCSDGTLVGAMDLCEAYNVPLQIHLSETQEEVADVLHRTGARPAIHLESLGLLRKRLIAAHAVHLDDTELELLCRRSVGIVHAPQSNMKLASGVARIADMLARGLHPALGTDGCASNNDLDLFREMDTAAKLSKVFSRDPAGLRASVALKMATQWGAEVVGLGKDIGTLEVGKKADIIVLDLRSPHLVPLYHPPSALVYSACGADVRHVMVNGRLLFKNRRFLTLDPEEIMARVSEISRGIAS